MSKTCFVIMGFGIKNNINLDLTYNEIIKPCIISNNLKPFSLYDEEKYNAFRCDEITGSTSIDYKFVTCLNGADIVIADISTMNVNAIYELGARHALKPRSTILLCALDKKHVFKFFDLNYVPIIFYEHGGKKISSKVIATVQEQLNIALDFAISSSTQLPDNPIQRALHEQNIYLSMDKPPQNVYALYLEGKKELDNNNFIKAEKLFCELYKIDKTEENLLLWVLAKYKQAEINKSYKGLIEALNLITGSIDIENSNSEYLFGRLAAICLRIYQLTDAPEYYYQATEYYRQGANFCKTNLYCPRNYCAMLIRIYEITDDTNVIREYYYTAKHYAKIFLQMSVSAKTSWDFDDRLYYQFNANDLQSIVSGKYENYDKLIAQLKSNDITKRQYDTIFNGVNKLKNDLNKVQQIIKFS